jgi:hypothetical protein|tara:strand:- start:44 stop:364 length:321 start_codon:yes stop_codon:yes gene_type:complete
MAFKMKPPFTPQPPIYERELEEGCLGKANKNGTILVAEGLPGHDEQSVIEHEKIHLDQMKRGDLWYDDEAVYWKGKKYSRDDMAEGNPDLPWEKEAYNKTDPYEAL